MRQPRTAKSDIRRPLVGIGVDGATGYGRAVMRGAMRYVNMQRRWLIHEEMRRIYADSEFIWPDCDGAIIGGVAECHIPAVLRSTRHTVRCSGSADPKITPVVCLDDVAVGATAAEHLIECQLRHFAYFGTALDSPLSRNRWTGFATTVAKRGFEASRCEMPWPTDLTRGSITHLASIVPWIQSLPKPVGILAMDDVAAHELAAACLMANVSVPDRVAIVGVNNDDLMCDSAWPPLSSVDCDYSRVGFHAAKILDRLLSGQHVPAKERLVRLPPLGVVRRMSSDVLAIDDPNIAEALRYIREHACEPCGVRDILRYVPVARRWLERQFVKKLGRTPHEEIMRVRIDTARRLLLQPELTVADVSARCGFAVVQNFGRAFLQVTGTTPGAMRRAARSGQST
ncbi:MAG: substrate-binding domain-containing protein [Tepidisphaeraceae bacterium]